MMKQGLQTELRFFSVEVFTVHTGTYFQNLVCMLCRTSHLLLQDMARDVIAYSSDSHPPILTYFTALDCSLR